MTVFVRCKDRRVSPQTRVASPADHDPRVEGNDTQTQRSDQRDQRRALVGRVPGWDNVWVATGHGANGLLQGPYSARVLAHDMAAMPLPADEVPLPVAFDPARFA